MLFLQLVEFDAEDGRVLSKPVSAAQVDGRESGATRNWNQRSVGQGHRVLCARVMVAPREPKCSLLCMLSSRRNKISPHNTKCTYPLALAACGNMALTCHAALEAAPNQAELRPEHFPDVRRRRPSVSTRQPS